MNTSQKIHHALCELQKHERLHWQLQQMLMQHSNAGFMVARSGMLVEQKWAALEQQRRDLLAALRDLGKAESIELPFCARAEAEVVPHAND